MRIESRTEVGAALLGISGGPAADSAQNGCNAQALSVEGVGTNENTHLPALVLHGPGQDHEFP